MKERLFISADSLVRNPAAAELYLMARKSESDRLKVELGRKMYERDGCVFAEVYGYWEMRLVGTTVELIPPKTSSEETIVASSLACAVAWIIARFH